MSLLIDLAKTVPIETGKFDFCGKGYDGWHEIYMDGDKKVTKNSIRLCENIKGDKKKYTQVAAHELGHQHFFIGLDDKQRGEWKKLYDASKKSEDFKRLYSQKGEMEDFADVFQHSFSVGDNRKRSKLFDAKIKWMNQTKNTAKDKISKYSYLNNNIKK